MTHPSNPLARRQLLLAGASAFTLAACGGGPVDGDAGPQIQSFTADREWAFLGERVRLTASFKGNARIEPGLGTVVSGVGIESAALDTDTAFRLVVELPGRPAVNRSLQVAVRFRNRYGQAFTGFVASQHVSVSASNGTVLLMGGVRGDASLSAAVDRFDPVTGRFSRAGTLAGGRSHHRALRLSSGRVMLTGGFMDHGDGRSTELVDELSGAVTATGPLNAPRVFHAALALADGRVLVSGGVNGRDPQGQPVSDTAELWEPSTGRFRPVVQRMSAGRAAHTMSLLPDGRVLVLGGHGNPGETRAAEVFDPRTERFTPLAATFAPRAHHAAHVDAQGRVVVLGGESLDANGQPVPLASVLRFDPASGHFATLPALREPRSGAGTVLLPSGQVLLLGGVSAAGRHSSTAERYDPAAGGQAIAALDSPRAWHTVTRLPSGRVLVAGGETSDGDLVPTALIYE